MREVVTVSNRKYYLGGIPSLKKDLGLDRVIRFNDFELANMNANFCHLRKAKDVFDIIAELRGWMKDLKQPSESTVRNAMIWTWDQDYSIKSGGESGSDHIYSSSLKWLVMNPKNGEDMDLVLLKKYSTKFEDVLITLEEMEALVDAIISPVQVVERGKRQVELVLGFMYGGFRRGKVNFTDNKEHNFNDEVKQSALNSIKDLNYPVIQEKYLCRLEDRLKRAFEIEIIEDRPGVNKNADYQKRCRTDMDAFHELKAYLENRTVGQAELFAA